MGVGGWWVGSSGAGPERVLAGPCRRRPLATAERSHCRAAASNSRVWRRQRPRAPAGWALLLAWLRQRWQARPRRTGGARHARPPGAGGGGHRVRGGPLRAAHVLLLHHRPRAQVLLDPAVDAVAPHAAQGRRRRAKRWHPLWRRFTPGPGSRGSSGRARRQVARLRAERQRARARAGGGAGDAHLPPVAAAAARLGERER
jgi:hypothetical protein